jgi:RNA polymerase sigma-B factor
MSRTPKRFDDELRTRNAELVVQLAVAQGPERKALIDRLALNNMRVAKSIAGRYGGRSEFRHDLEQVACLALVRAALDFDAGRGHEFLAYAVPCITGAVKRYFRDSAWVIRPPRPVQERHSASSTGTEHVADGVQVETCFRPWSLDVPPPGDLAPLGETLADGTDQTWEQSEARLLLEPHLRALPLRAQQVLYLRFYEDHTQQEIADTLGISQYHVSRMLSRYVEELRATMANAA